MTTRLLALGYDLQARLLTGGAPQHMEPVLRDGWASLYRWRQAGQHVYRIRAARPCPQDLDLRALPRLRACCYQLLDRCEWIVLAAHEAGEPIDLGPGAGPWAYPEPMITWVCDGEPGRDVATGCLNLDQARTWREAWIQPGHRTSRDGARRALHTDDLSGVERRLALALPWWLEKNYENEIKKRP